MPTPETHELIHATILGVVQGLTEFLPVSSSGHLEIGKAILNTDMQGEESLMMTVVLHAATALSTIVVFYRDIWDIVRGIFRGGWKLAENEDLQFLLKIVLSMIPAVVVGLTMEDQIDALFSGNLLLVGGMLILTGLLLFLAGRATNTDRPVRFWDAVVVGVSQAVAILPGISRSGATISTCVLLGVDRSRAARFSFLMVVPLILGKMAKDLLDDKFAANTQSLALLVGFAAAFVTGVIACRWMIALVRNCQLWWFSLYCFVVGAIAIGYAMLPAATPATTG